MRYGVTMFATDLSIDVVDSPGRSRSGASTRCGCPSTPHPHQPPHPAPQRRDAREVQALARPAGRQWRRRVPPRRCAWAPASFCRPSADLIVTAKAVASLDHVSGKAGRPRRRVRLERGRDRRPRRRLPAPPGDRASTLAMQALWRDEGRVHRRARVAPARGRGPNPPSATARRLSVPVLMGGGAGPSCSPTPSSTPTAGCPSVAPA